MNLTKGQPRLRQLFNRNRRYLSNYHPVGRHRADASPYTRGQQLWTLGVITLSFATLLLLTIITLIAKDL
jgi:hypothetical protein